jgi:hypothetical protein
MPSLIRNILIFCCDSQYGKPIMVGSASTKWEIGTFDASARKRLGLNTDTSVVSVSDVKMVSSRMVWCCLDNVRDQKNSDFRQMKCATSCWPSAVDCLIEKIVLNIAKYPLVTFGDSRNQLFLAALPFSRLAVRLVLRLPQNCFSKQT